MSTLDDAFATYVLAIANSRARPLKAVNTRDSLEARAAIFEQVIQATAQYLEVLKADTCHHFNVRQRDLDFACCALADAGSEVRMILVEAIDDVAHAATGGAP